MFFDSDELVVEDRNFLDSGFYERLAGLPLQDEVRNLRPLSDWEAKIYSKKRIGRTVRFTKGATIRDLEPVVECFKPLNATAYHIRYGKNGLIMRFYEADNV